MLQNIFPISIYLSPFFLKDFIYLFLKRGVGEEKERERNIDVRKIHGEATDQGPNPHTPWPGI